MINYFVEYWKKEDIGENYSKSEKMYLN